MDKVALFQAIAPTIAIVGVAIVLGAVFAQPLVLRRRVEPAELAPP